MKSIVGALLIVALCIALLVVVYFAEELHLGHLAISLGVAVFGGLMYRITRWMRGPGSEFGTPVPSLGLTERELDKDTPEDRS